MDIRITLDATPTLEALLRRFLEQGCNHTTEAMEPVREAPAASQSAPVQEQVKEQPKKVTFEDLAAVAGRLVDAGKKDELVAFLQNELNATALAFLKPEDYGKALTGMQSMEGGESCAE